MQSNHSASAPTERISVRYTSKPVSGWGGLLLAFRYFERQGVWELLSRALPDGRRSPNQIPVVTMALSLFATVLTGGRRFAHAERLREDEVVKRLLGAKRLPSPMTLTRYFGGFVRSQVEQLAAVLADHTRTRLVACGGGDVLDLDSTVFERYGQQQGSLKGHNPRKHGRPSHHPLLALLARQKLVLHSWLRSGNSGSARGVSGFLAEVLARLPEGFVVEALRADAGFFVREFLQELERRRLPYAIAVRTTKLVQHAIVGLTDWQPIERGLEVAETRYCAPSWKTSRRIVVVRERIRERPDAKGRRLFELPGYTFHTLVTTLDRPAIEVWRFYNGRADCENRLKELKYDYGADGFCLHTFDGTEAVFRLICALYNLVAAFKADVTHDPAPQLSRLRTQHFVTGAIVGRDGREVVLRLGLRGRYRERFATLLERIDSIAQSTVTQLRNTLEPLAFIAARPWRARPPQRSVAPSSAMN
jgi:hypothetical protein